MYLLTAVLCSAALSVTTAQGPTDDIPLCPNLNGDEFAVLDTLQVHEDVADKLVGEFIEVWGPQNTQKTCVKTVYGKTSFDNRTDYSRALYVKNFDADKEITFKNLAVKVANGVYLVKRYDGYLISKIHVLKADGNILAYFTCPFQPVRPNETIRRMTFVFIKKSSLPQALDKSLQDLSQFLSMVDAYKNLLGKVVQKDTTCVDTIVDVEPAADAKYN